MDRTIVMDRPGSQSRRKRAERLVGEILPFLLAFVLLGTATMGSVALASEAPSNNPIIASYLEAKAGPLWQFAQARPGSGACEPDPRKNDTISAALTRRAKAV